MSEHQYALSVTKHHGYYKLEKQTSHPPRYPFQCVICGDFKWMTFKDAVAAKVVAVVDLDEDLTWLNTHMHDASHVGD